MIRRSCARNATQTPTAAACFLEPQLMLEDTAMSSIRRVLINVSELRRVPVDPKDIYFLEAAGATLWFVCDPNALCATFALSALY